MQTAVEVKGARPSRGSENLGQSTVDAGHGNAKGVDLNSSVPNVPFPDIPPYSDPKFVQACRECLPEFLTEVDGAPVLRQDAFVTLQHTFKFEDLGQPPLQFSISDNLAQFAIDYFKLPRERETLSIAELLHYWQHCREALAKRPGQITINQLINLGVDSKAYRGGKADHFQCSDIQNEVGENISRLVRIVRQNCEHLSSNVDEVSQDWKTPLQQKEPVSFAQLESLGFPRPSHFGDYFFYYLKHRGPAVKSKFLPDGKSQIDIAEVQEYLAYCHSSLRLSVLGNKRETRVSRGKLLAHRIANSNGTGTPGSSILIAPIQQEINTGLGVLAKNFSAQLQALPQSPQPAPVTKAVPAPQAAVNSQHNALLASIDQENTNYVERRTTKVHLPRLLGQLRLGHCIDKDSTVYALQDAITLRVSTEALTPAHLKNLLNVKSESIVLGWERIDDRKVHLPSAELIARIGDVYNLDPFGKRVLYAAFAVAQTAKLGQFVTQEAMSQNATQFEDAIACLPKTELWKSFGRLMQQLRIASGLDFSDGHLYAWETVIREGRLAETISERMAGQICGQSKDWIQQLEQGQIDPMDHHAKNLFQFYSFGVAPDTWTKLEATYQRLAA